MILKEDIFLPNIEEVHVSEATYYRLFFDKYLNSNINNYIYIDADVVCLNNPEEKINKVFKKMQKEKYVIAARTESIVFENEKQKQLIDNSFRKLENIFNKKIVTLVWKFEKFYKAETYHQDYYEKNFIRYLMYKKGCQREETLKKIWN